MSVDVSVGLTPENFGYGPGHSARAVLWRYIRTLNWGNQYGTFNTPISAAIGDTVSIQFNYPAGGAARNLTEQVLFDAANLLQLTSCTATIDGVAVASGASMAAYIDGNIHTIVLTATAPFTMTYLGQSGVGTNFYAGAVFDVTHTVAATGAVLAYVIDNPDTATTYARGHVSPSALYITWTNVTTEDIQPVAYNSQLSKWVFTTAISASAIFMFRATDGLLSYMFTDRAGTLPVTAADDFVGYIADRSGNGSDLVAVSDAGRALYKTDGSTGWIQLDKVDDNYSTTFAAPIVGTMLIGTRKGTVHLEVNIPAGAWSLTTNAAYFPGNTITDIIIKDGVMTAAELANAKAWLSSRGSPSVYTPTGGDFLYSFRQWGVVTRVVGATIDLSSINANGFAAAYYVNKLSSVEDVLTPQITDFYFTYSTNSIVEIPSGYFDGCPNVTRFNRCFDSNPLLTTVPAGLFATQTVCTDYTNCFLGTALTQQSIDNVLASIRVSYTANGLTGGTFTQSGGSAPSVAGQADIDYLRAQGMTVTVTGGY